MEPARDNSRTECPHNPTVTAPDSEPRLAESLISRVQCAVTHRRGISSCSILQRGSVTGAYCHHPAGTPKKWILSLTALERSSKLPYDTTTLSIQDMNYE
jgi:hypothetical protein